MASRLNPYLGFRGQAREAMEFYRSVLGGELTVSTYGDMGMQGDQAERIMHAQLDTDLGFTLMASDVSDQAPMTPGNNVQVSISGDDAEALRGYWAKLSDGGSVYMPFEKQAWGDEFGGCVDRFGISWMVDVTPPKS